MLVNKEIFEGFKVTSFELKQLDRIQKLAEENDMKIQIGYGYEFINKMKSDEYTNKGDSVIFEYR